MSSDKRTMFSRQCALTVQNAGAALWVTGLPIVAFDILHLRFAGEHLAAEGGLALTKALRFRTTTRAIFSESNGGKNP